MYWNSFKYYWCRRVWTVSIYLYLTWLISLFGYLVTCFLAVILVFSDQALKSRIHFPVVGRPLPPNYETWLVLVLHWAKLLPWFYSEFMVCSCLFPACFNVSKLVYFCWRTTYTEAWISMQLIKSANILFVASLHLGLLLMVGMERYHNHSTLSVLHQIQNFHICSSYVRNWKQTSCPGALF